MYNFSIENFIMVSGRRKERIKTSQRKGIDFAKKHGKHLRRRKSVITNEFIQAYQEWKQKQITAVETMK